MKHPFNCMGLLALPALAALIYFPCLLYTSDAADEL